MSTYTVYASKIEEVQKRLDRLAKKAANYNIPFSYTICEEHPQTVAIREHDAHVVWTAITFVVSAVDVTVNCEDLIRANGWTIRAKVEHGEHGNIVTSIGDKPVSSEWYTAPARCDHCKTNRFRSVTYFCENEAGDIRQVGRTCLKDYTGISSATAAMWAEVQDILVDDMSYTAHEWDDLCRSMRACSISTMTTSMCTAWTIPKLSTRRHGSWEISATMN